MERPLDPLFFSSAPLFSVKCAMHGIVYRLKSTDYVGNALVQGAAVVTGC